MESKAEGNIWIIKDIRDVPELNDPVLIEGLPGIGNVGKVAVDFLIDELDAKKVCSFHSYSMPHSVFVTENNLVELPNLTLYYVKRKKGRDLLLLAGDIQPIDEMSCYQFSERMLDVFKELGGKEIITLGGIGLQEVPETPKVYCTANKRAIVTRYKKGVKIHDKLYGVVGPIIGVSGLLVGMATDWKMQAIALLAETYGHPMHLGIKGAREILKIISKKHGISLKLSELDREVKKIEEELLKRKEEVMDVQSTMSKSKKTEEVKYIG